LNCLVEKNSATSILVNQKKFIKFQFGDLIPAKRLTPKSTQIGNNVNWYNTRNVLGIYDKQKHDLIFCKPTSTDNPLFSSGIYNDLDGGPRSLPQKQINDSTIVMWVDARQLKEHGASDDFKNANPKFPEKNRELEKLAGWLSELDNPVLMMVTFKR
jgi:hypothetical protein